MKVAAGAIDYPPVGKQNCNVVIKSRDGFFFKKPTRWANKLKLKDELLKGKSW